VIWGWSIVRYDLEEKGVREKWRDLCTLPGCSEEPMQILIHTYLIPMLIPDIHL